MQTVSISRLHKLAERLKQRVSELNDEATNNFSAEQIRGEVYANLTERVAARVQAGLEAVRQAEMLGREAAKIRAVIAHHNERLGISRKLAQQDILSRQLAQLKTLSSVTNLRKVDEIGVGQKVSEYGESFDVLTSDVRAELKKQTDRLQREVYGLSDEVAEANATRVEIELPAEVLDLITG